MSESLVEINVGGCLFTTKIKTLLTEEQSYFTKSLNASTDTFDICKDANGRLFIDRDGSLFKHVLDYLRNRYLVLPENFAEMRRLRSDAEFYELSGMLKLLGDSDSVNTKMSSFSLCGKRSKGCIIIGYRGSFTFGGG